MKASDGVAHGHDSVTVRLALPETELHAIRHCMLHFW
jgi:hypothetical protein